MNLEQQQTYQPGVKGNKKGELQANRRSCRLRTSRQHTCMPGVLGEAGALIQLHPGQATLRA
eukprot:1158453-Pelagomonas_calceolata.AAC.2